MIKDTLESITAFFYLIDINLAGLHCPNYARKVADGFYVECWYDEPCFKEEDFTLVSYESKSNSLFNVFE